MCGKENTRFLSEPRGKSSGRHRESLTRVRTGMQNLIVKYPTPSTYCPVPRNLLLSRFSNACISHGKDDDQSS